MSNLSSSTHDLDWKLDQRLDQRLDRRLDRSPLGIQIQYPN